MVAASKVQERWVARALLMALGLHIVALLATALLMPAFGFGMLDAERRFATAHAVPAWTIPALWCLWGLADLGNIALALAVARRSPSRPLAWAVVILMVAAATYDISIEIRHAVALAHGAPSTLAAFKANEAAFLLEAAGFVSLVYAPAFAALTVALASSQPPRGWLTSSLALWTAFACIGVFAIIALPSNVGFILLANAFVFLAMLAGMVWTIEWLLRKTWVTGEHGRWAPWRPAVRLSWLLRFVANSRFLRFIAAPLPVPAMRSDIRQVVYVNYLVPANKLQHLTPRGFELQRVGPGGKYAVFSFLAFKHGHFGPAMLGPLRRLFPSPLQSNWRIYVKHRASGRTGVYFTANTCDNPFYAAAARLVSDTVSMDVVRPHDWQFNHELTLHIDPAGGTGPDAVAHLQPGPAMAKGPWSTAFPDWQAMLRHVVPQDRAMSPRPWRDDVVREEISLDASLQECVPLQGPVQSAWVERNLGPAKPFCFLVPNVRLTLRSHGHDPL